MLPREQETGRKAYLSISSYHDIYALLFTIYQFESRLKQNGGALRRHSVFRYLARNSQIIDKDDVELP
jgi:hypothetical protein